MQQIKSRIRWVDAAKAIGIFAIVLGHTLRGGLLKKYVYTFHVPLFFFLCGATCHVGEKKFTTFLKARAKQLLVPFIVFALISQCVYILGGGICSKCAKFRAYFYSQGRLYENSIRFCRSK